MKTLLPRAVAAVFVLAGISLTPNVFADSYVVLANNNLSARMEADLQAGGATITARIPEIGVLLIESPDGDFRDTARNAHGVHSVAANITLNWQLPVAGEAISMEAASPPFTGDDDFFFDLQWGHTAISATDAWEMGYRGAGVRVAVLDSGIDADHPDLAPNLNLALSTSFVPGEGVDVGPGFFFNHGTHVAGTIGAADNAFGTIGVAPEVELVAVKVLSQSSGSGSFGGIIQGIVYAALINADVINMSLGASIPRNCSFDDGAGGRIHFPASDCNALFTATGRATAFAYRNGSTIIAAAGNSGRDMDHDGSLKDIPTELPGVFAISATGPVGWAFNPANADLDRLASYSNSGQSAVDFAAPGGDFVLPGEQSCGIAPCWILDMVMSTIAGGWGWSAGTSMAAPHASGVAALIIGKNGGSMHPAQVIAVMQQSADDLGKPGNDDAYGAGRINAASAVAN